MKSTSRSLLSSLIVGLLLSACGGADEARVNPTYGSNLETAAARKKLGDWSSGVRVGWQDTSQTASTPSTLTTTTAFQDSTTVTEAASLPTDSTTSAPQGGTTAETSTAATSLSTSNVDTATADATTAASSPSATNVSANSWIDTIVSDMALYHDGPSAVLESIRGWGSGANMPEATTKPDGWLYAIPWTHLMRDTSSSNGNGYPWRVPGPYTGNQAPNTRLQQRDIQMWWLLSNGQWVLGAHNAVPGSDMYPTNWAEGTQISGAAEWRNETNNGGGASMRSIGRESFQNHVWHAWGSAHLVPANAVGAVTVFFARLILNDPNGADDRHLAHLMAAGSGDWYKDAATISGQKAQGVNVYYMGFSRFKYVKPEWQMFAWTSLSESQLRANPPPIIGLIP